MIPVHRIFQRQRRSSAWTTFWRKTCPLYETAAGLNGPGRVRQIIIHHFVIAVNHLEGWFDAHNSPIWYPELSVRLNLLVSHQALYTSRAIMYSQLNSLLKSNVSLQPPKTKDLHWPMPLKLFLHKSYHLLTRCTRSIYHHHHLTICVCVRRSKGKTRPHNSPLWGSNLVRKGRKCHVSDGQT